MTDLEYGPITLSNSMQKLADYYRNNKKKIKYFSVGFFVLTIALIIKLGYNNVESVIETASAITLDEAAYKPFTWSETMISTVDSKSVKKVVIKESHVNWKSQSLNILKFRDHVMEYLKSGDYICIHARHFDVPFDIIIFQNNTMINPNVDKESDTYQYVKEQSLDGTITRHKRPDTLDIVYTDSSLNRQYITLYGDQAACFCHYEF